VLIAASACASGDDESAGATSGAPPASKCAPPDLELAYATILAVNEDSVFVVDQGPFDGAGSRLVQIAKACDESRLVAEELSWVLAVEADQAHVYWLARDGLYRAPTGGGAVEALDAPGVGTWGNGALFLDDQAIWFAADFAVKRLDRAPGAVATIIAKGCSVNAIAVDATDVWFATEDCGGEVSRAPKSGGAATVVAPKQHSASIAVDDGHVYWRNDRFGALTRWPKTGVEGDVFPVTVARPGGFHYRDGTVWLALGEHAAAVAAAGSAAWLDERPAFGVRHDGERLWVAGGDRLARLSPEPPVAAGFATGSGALTVSWNIDGAMACEPHSRMSIFLDGASGRNATLPCEAYSHRFEALAPGEYFFRVIYDRPNGITIGLDDGPFVVGDGETAVGPFDMGPCGVIPEDCR
jgi:hypothetical protein